MLVLLLVLVLGVLLFGGLSVFVAKAFFIGLIAVVLISLVSGGVLRPLTPLLPRHTPAFQLRKPPNSSGLPGDHLTVHPGRIRTKPHTR